METIREKNERNYKRTSKAVLILGALIVITIVGLAWGLPFTFGESNNTWLWNNKVIFGLYLALKIFFICYLIGWIIWWYIKLTEKPRSIFAIVMPIALVGQGLPGLLRVAQFIPNFDIGYCAILFTLFVILYLGLMILAIIYTKDYDGTEGLYRGKEEKVRDLEKEEKERASASKKPVKAKEIKIGE